MLAAIGFSNRFSTFDLSTCSPPCGSESYWAAFEPSPFGGGDVAGRDVADRLELGIAVDVRQDVVDAGPDERQRVGHDAVRCVGQPGQDVAVAVERVDAAAAAEHVREDVREEVRRSRRPRPPPGVGGADGVVVELLRRRDDLGLAVAGDVAERGAW